MKGRSFSSGEIVFEMFSGVDHSRAADAAKGDLAAKANTLEGNSTDL